MSPRRVLALTASATALLFAAPAFAALPIVDYALTGTPGDNSWYVGSVTVKWTLLNETSSSPGCLTQTLDTETAGTTITCIASNSDGPVQATTKPIRIDKTAPTDVTAAAARAPDTRLWFTSPVGITWSGNDALSGIASCSALSYAGPDATAAAPTGTCRDRAGNLSPAVAFPLDYDATPPALADVTATTGPGRADIRWAAGTDATRVTVVREPSGAGVPAKTVADGPAATTVAADTDLAPATTYTWTVTALDDAGNAASQRATATTPLAPIHPTGGGATKSAKRKAIQLRWLRTPRASYYNLQVFRGQRKVLSAWPAGPRFRLASNWRYRGRTERLIAGRTYRWYAWAGYGARSAHRYGRLLAHGRFTIPATGL